MIRLHSGKIILCIVCIAVFFSCFWFPITRDELYYLEGYTNPFLEYYNSYLTVNPRIGQFFSNLIGRSFILELVFGLMLFIGFFYVFYLFIFKKTISFRSNKEVSRLLVIVAVFVFLINQFGEMFYYVPFSTNYTLTHIFYILYLYILGEFYIDEKNHLSGKNSFLILIILFGVFVGMGNEHVPPVLLALSGIGGVYYLLRYKKMPNIRMIILNLSVLLGYFLIFFAPAQSTRYGGKGASVIKSDLGYYIQGFVKIGKVFYYRNPEIIIMIFVVLVLLIFLRKKIAEKEIIRILLLIFTGFATFFILVFSPFVESRLIFFSNCLFILAICIFGKELLKHYSKYSIVIFTLASSYLIVFFSMSVFVCYQANRNYNQIISEIIEKRRSGDNVVLEASFNFETKELGKYNRKIILDKGTDYIDDNFAEDTSPEYNLKKYYHLKSISTKTKK